MSLKRTELNKLGPKSREWIKIRKAWIKANPPNHEGYYVCGICGMAVHSSDMELDHIDSRSRSPASFADFSNLQPTHKNCNQEKGSKYLEAKVSASEYGLRNKLNL